jgi:hypothetical protein
LILRTIGYKENINENQNLFVVTVCAFPGTGAPGAGGGCKLWSDTGTVKAFGFPVPGDYGKGKHRAGTAAFT